MKIKQPMVISVVLAATVNAHAAAKPAYSAYPTGLYSSVAVSAFYRDMRHDSGWAYLYGNASEHHFSSMGVSGALELGYQSNQHWGLAMQGGWVPEQQVKTLGSGSDFAAGDYRKLKTDWTALLVTASLKMDYRYYFTAKLGVAYMYHELNARTESVSTRLKHDRMVPTMAVAVQYQLNHDWGIGVQYQLMMGRENWKHDWDGAATRIPVLQQLGLVAAYQFNV